MSLPDPSFLLARAPVVPVVTVPSVAAGVKLAQALVEGGLPLIEVTLRTPVALEAMAAIAAEVPDAIVGAGTVTRPELIQKSIDAGARFLVSPGCPPALAEALAEAPVPVMPGCATATEAMTLHAMGFPVLKLFPAESAGGVALIKSLAGPLPDLRFCPTGGIGPANVGSYLAQPNILAVGGSWVAPGEAVTMGDWEQIASLAKAASKLHRAAFPL
ncbi:bifunctional 4-hydroxy-2-oxoglutarate aldolase/2-dehydro-3-deoxy-phosphogluconate aldolase [Ancylobacter mangrovi]|uniref:bifunctional 4-hydroxy-2-oxoglutarate aldolase/2-dehydro-3-deoxy-phosphogluconate aldolase n=1 Tax=Ancylobacter mangrovi TaxID=2972472 RepID=UPI00216324E9|nr:bifunctional 4-hydroxy-2-oxoglutarate aldolase/2-dehydro-3-deoxy-phosphogluconate aldolase [Ancylobacter mangrovi]MCS0503951.1 bifunctional 4-hydroxy-2-oxoglutarate aldolase/2-dehydro-3-deoxy-phosphogluconate aldolase [Ancylobacter mangrovi]